MKLNNGNPEIARHAQTIACVAVLLITVLASCQNPASDGGQNPPGAVTITLAGAGGAARSIMPSAPSFSRYALTLQKGGTTQTPDASGLATDGVMVQLEPGNWSVTVDAFQELDHDGNAETPVRGYKAATATITFLVTAEGSNLIEVQLEPIALDAADAPQGVFVWNITLPDGVDSASMSLGTVSGLTDLDLTQAVNRSGFTEVGSGVYSLTILLSKDGLSTGSIEKVYIYGGLQTTAAPYLSDLVFGSEVLIAGALTVTGNSGSASEYEVNAYASEADANSESNSIGTVLIPSIVSEEFLLGIPASAYNTLGAGTAWGKKVYLRATHPSAEIRENSVVTVDNLPVSGSIGWNVSITVVSIYTVSYDANGGSGTVPASQTVNEGAIVMIAEQGDLTRLGYNFTGWNTSAYGSGTAYNASNSLMVNADTTLYAQWDRLFGEFVKKIDFTGPTATTSFDNLSGHDIFLVKINKSDLVVNAADTGGAVGPLAPWSPAPAPNPSPSLGYATELPRMGHPLAELFNANPPPIPALPPSGSGPSTALGPSPIVGAIREFWVESTYGNGIFVQKQATLRATGTYSNVWVMDSDYNNSSSTTDDKKLTTAQAQALAEKFDLIYPVETKLLGYEYGGAGSADPGGKDGDIKVQILVYDFGGGSAAGFFWSKDFYTSEYLVTYWGANYKSNLAEIFYLDVDQLDLYPSYMYSVLVHEFQHMINFNVKTVEKGVLYTETWYNEMLSMMAEDTISPLIGIGPTFPTHPIGLRIDTFLEDYDQEGITDWFQSDTSYSIKFAFGAYLLRNYGGAELFQKILANDTSNIASISAALNELNPGMDFYKALEYYGEAFIYSGTNRPEGVMSFDNTISKTISGTVYTHTGFDIWNSYSFEGGYSPMPWAGPKIFDVAQTEMRPTSVLVQSSADWRNKTGDFSITLDKPASDDIVLYLMVK